VEGLARDVPEAAPAPMEGEDKGVPEAPNTKEGVERGEALPVTLWVRGGVQVEVWHAVLELEEELIGETEGVEVSEGEMEGVFERELRMVPVGERDTEGEGEYVGIGGLKDTVELLVKTIDDVEVPDTLGLGVLLGVRRGLREKLGLTLCLLVGVDEWHGEIVSSGEREFKGEGEDRRDREALEVLEGVEDREGEPVEVIVGESLLDSEGEGVEVRTAVPERMGVGV